ncbi:hypothetical protein AB0I10_25930 [Streptomyces sp. NPDC050636]|uniref:hypothetical protein n=1 Tax=Streptomyces sp. NPDC050636 TaxID=3154510 RepID=UPI0034461E3C
MGSHLFTPARTMERFADCWTGRMAAPDHVLYDDAMLSVTTSRQPAIEPGHYCSHLFALCRQQPRRQSRGLSTKSFLLGLKSADSRSEPNTFNHHVTPTHDQESGVR